MNKLLFRNFVPDRQTKTRPLYISFSFVRTRKNRFNYSTTGLLHTFLYISINGMVMLHTSESNIFLKKFTWYCVIIFVIILCRVQQLESEPGKWITKRDATTQVTTKRNFAAAFSFHLCNKILFTGPLYKSRQTAVRVCVWGWHQLTYCNRAAILRNMLSWTFPTADAGPIAGLVFLILDRPRLIINPDDPRSISTLPMSSHT